MVSVSRSPQVVRANRRHRDDPDRRLAHQGWFYSWRNRDMLPYRGTLALDFLTLAESHPRVHHIHTKPRPIDWWDGVAWQSFVPRYAVVLKTAARGVTRVVDVEVIFQEEYDRDRAKYRRIKREARRDGRVFLVFTERKIRLEPRLTNAQLVLTQAGERLVPEDDKNLVRQVSHASKGFTLNQLVEIGVLTYPRAYAAALNMVAAGELAISLDRRFDGDSVIAGRGGYG